jgi:ABC-type dipeptide/oligopeptide/nickel transport system permease component
LYGIVMLTPATERATLYLPASLNLDRITEQQYQVLIDRIIKERGLNEPFLVQYVGWLGTLLSGNLGYSPVVRVPVQVYLKTRMPVTAELTLYSILLFIPAGILSGAVAAWTRNRKPDHGFRFTAFTATSVPPFILGLMMISFLYVGLKWFAPGRLSQDIEMFVKSTAFHSYTGLVTIDGVLNGRLDVTLDAFKHLVMPVVTLSAVHWATLGRVTRQAMIEELDRNYIIAAKARGVPQRLIIWRHALRNAMVPAVTSSGLSIASLVTGVYVIEVVFNFHGVSELITASGSFGIPDAPAALGFALYSVIVVLVVMFVLDVVQAMVDPRLRERLSE